MPTAIHIERLVKRYAPAPAAPAVDGVSLAIEPGELFFLLGPSGCGKTTLLRMIAGFIDPTDGTIAFADGEGGKGNRRDVTHLPPNKRNTGMVFQSYALWPHMSVFDNVAFGLSVRKVDKTETQRRVMEALAMVQMDPYAQRKPNALSGGQQQRVALARALVIRPDVLLLDEPLSNLDAKLRIELRSEIRRICKSSGITGVYVTHDQKEALSMADRCAVMKAGHIVQLGTPHSLYHQPTDRFVAEFLGETNFIQGTLQGSSVLTPAGELRSGQAAPAGAATGGPVTLSLRPEALRLSPGVTEGPNTLVGRIVESTYLGEIAQHTVELAGGGGGKGGAPTRIKVAQLNPGPVLAAPGGAVSMSIAPADVVILPA